MLKKVIFLLTTVFSLQVSVFAQPENNDCVNAIDLCPNRLMTFDNIDASSTICANCEDDFNFCFTPNNTVWFKFTTNAAGGNVQVDFSNLAFEDDPGQSQKLQAMMFKPAVACDGSTYSPIGNCMANATGNFSLSATLLEPNTTYYLVVGGDMTGTGITIAAECTFNLVITGTAVVRPEPFLSITPSATSICKNDIVTFTSTLANCPDSSAFQWYVNGELVAVTNENFYQTASLNNGDFVSVQTSCFEVCKDTISTTTAPLTVTEVQVNAGLDQITTPDKEVRLYGFTNATNMFWMPDFNLSDPFTYSSVAWPQETTIYVLTVEENGCVAQDEVKITVIEEVEIPNTFSPNGDGINDKFEIVFIEMYPNNRIQIFDRWGQRVFEASGYDFDKAWDGKIKDDVVAEGVYFYNLELKDDRKRVYKGSVTIIK